MKKILFLCTANSIRSQIAEGVARFMGQGAVEVFSAGAFGGGSVHPMAVAVLEEYGADTDILWSKGLHELPDVNFDAVIALSDEAEEALDQFAAAALRETWTTPDPLAIPTATDRKDAFRQVRDTLEEQIEELLRKLA